MVSNTGDINQVLKLLSESVEVEAGSTLSQDQQIQSQGRLPSSLPVEYKTGWWFQTWLLLPISYMGCHPSHWRSHIFQDGYCTTNQKWILCLPEREPSHCDWIPVIQRPWRLPYSCCSGWNGPDATDVFLHQSCSRLEIKKKQNVPCWMFWWFSMLRNSGLVRGWVLHQLTNWNNHGRRGEPQYCI